MKEAEIGELKNGIKEAEQRAAWASGKGVPVSFHVCVLVLVCALEVSLFHLFAGLVGLCFLRKAKHDFVEFFFNHWDRLLLRLCEVPGKIRVVASGQEKAKKEEKKQGAYGKVKTHKHGKLATLIRPRELLAGIRYKLSAGKKRGFLQEGAPESLAAEDLAFCEATLCSVSRSFAGVIKTLPQPNLRLPVAVFYLVLRALDTIEDEMNLSRFEPHKAEAGDAKTLYEAKLILLRSFYQKLKLSAKEDEKGWTLSGVGEAEERRLLEEFDKVLRVYWALDPAQQQIIAEITERMAQGMADFAGRDLAAGTKDKKEFNLYCHYVAGLVGHGLTKQWAASGLESPERLLGEEGMRLANSMGLFLQKTNIIRDYLEDLVDNRSFWPEDVWSLYAGSLMDLQEGTEQAVACLNHMITDVLSSAQDSLSYLEMLKDPKVFHFCAVPQIMAIATLAELYKNKKVFTGVVKIRSGLAARLLQDCADMTAVRRWFAHFASKILAAIEPADPNAARTAVAARALGAK